MKNITQNISRYLTILCFTTGFATHAIAQDDAQNTKPENIAAENTQNTKPENTITQNNPNHASQTLGKQFKSLSEMIRQNMPNAAATADAAIQQKIKGTTVTPEARQYVDAIQKYYDNAKTYSATFEQEFETVDGIKKVSTGTVWFKKPGMMRWDYDTPETRFIISDAESLWTWEPVYRQFCKQSLKGSQLPSALSFLTGTGKIEDDFSVKLDKINGNQVQLELIPAEPSLAYESMKFEILMPSAKVYRATIYDAMGNLNRITFKSPEINAELDNNSFRFNPPQDARHICE